MFSKKRDERVIRLKMDIDNKAEIIIEIMSMATKPKEEKPKAKTVKHTLVPKTVENAKTWC